MTGQADKKRNQQSDATTEGSQAAFARQKLPARFLDEISNISNALNGACRLHFFTWSTDDAGQPLRIDTELILTRTTLTTLAEALPRALAQADDYRTKSPGNSTDKENQP